MNSKISKIRKANKSKKSGKEEEGNSESFEPTTGLEDQPETKRPPLMPPLRGHPPVIYLMSTAYHPAHRRTTRRAASSTTITEPASVSSVAGPEPASLSTEESTELSQLESAITRNLTGFLEVGRALIAIRDKRLYRAQSSNFNEYVKQRFGLERSHAHRFMQSAEVAENLSPIGDRSLMIESNLRPLVKLKPKDQPRVWERSLEMAGNCRPTAAVVEAAIDEVLPPKPLFTKEQSKAQSTPLESSGAAPDTSADQTAGRSTSSSDSSTTMVKPEGPAPEDFELADGSRLPYSAWIPGGIPEDRIRNQLLAIKEGAMISGKKEDLDRAVLSQSLVVGFGAVLHQMISTVSPGKMTEAVMRNALDSINEASTRVVNCIVSLPTEPSEPTSLPAFVS